MTWSVGNYYIPRRKKILVTFPKIESLFGGKILKLSFLIVVAQLIDTYIRLLAFSSKVSDEIKRRLGLKYLLWGVASFFLYNFLFAIYSINAATYKAILMLGWLPYFIITMKYIKWGLPQHVFVLGMSTICSMMQHTICAIIILNVFVWQNDAELILIEVAGYLLLFLIFLPLYRKYFINLLPSREFFDMRPQGWYIAILPLIIVSTHIIRIADDVLVHSWAERFSRLYLPLIFFFFYRYILSATKNFYDMQRLERNKIMLMEKLSELKEYSEWNQENQTKISVMRHDLRHSYNIIYMLLENGEVDKALEHIKSQENLLGDKK